MTGEDLPGLKARMAYVAELQFFWYKWADTEKLKAEMDHMISTIDPDIIAPSHAPVFTNGAQMLELWRDEIIDTVANNDVRHMYEGGPS
jgi:hypothetical protein